VMWHLADISSVAITQLRTLVMIRILLTLALCLPLLTPGIASAKKPNPGNVSCELFVSPYRDAVYTGSKFSVKLVRAPSYPGAFRNPTVTIDVIYTLSDNSELIQTSTRTISRFNVTYVEMDFTAPSADENGVLPVGEATIVGTVSEQTKSKKNKTNITSCTTTVTVDP